jgi:hypothetical protein
MAFNFYGTASLDQLNALNKFSKYQEQDIKDRIAYLNMLLQKVGKFTTTFDSDTGLPSKYSASPDISYGAKLLAAYRAMGGVPEKDFFLRTRDKPVTLAPGTGLTNDPDNVTGGYSSTLSDGTRVQSARFDRDIGVRTEVAKRWMLEIIKRKREYLEFKIKRTIDYSDNIQLEIDMLKEMRVDPLSSADFKQQDIINTALMLGSMGLIAKTGDPISGRVGEVVDVTREADLIAANAEDGLGPSSLDEEEAVNESGDM